MKPVRQTRWEWRLRLAPLKGGQADPWFGIDPYIRMRRLLKAALRSHGFRCHEIAIKRRKLPRRALAKTK